MIIDGRVIAKEIQEALKREHAARDRKLSLGVVMATDDLATRKFVERKRLFGESIGVEVSVKEFAIDASSKELVHAVHESAKEYDGVVVQLPLPNNVDIHAIRNAVPFEKDVDAISDKAVAASADGSSKVLPPVVGAIALIADRYNISFSGKRVAVVGSGRLVGKPSSVWARRQGAEVIELDSDSYDASYELQKADIIILGAGSPGMLMPEMVQNGVAIFDAGTSEAKGKLAGDADPACAEKASIFTPVPGGIGPITVAMIFKNLLVLSA